MNFSQVSDRIVTRRYELKLSQIELAERAHMNKGYLSRIENGKFKKCSPKTLNRIAKALNVKVGWLLSVEDDNPVKKARTA